MDPAEERFVVRGEDKIIEAERNIVRADRSKKTKKIFEFGCFRKKGILWKENSKQMLQNSSFF